MKFAAFSAAALLSMAATSAQAADLGGNCCADLEERIAELEATTARKGNRKVSLTISGWVAEQIGYWDTGEESNVYVGGIGGTLSSHVKFTGGAKIDADNSVGYVLHLRAISTNIFGVSEDNDNSAAANSTAVYYSYWFVKNEKLGKVSVGQQSQASDNAAIVPDQSGTLVAANWAMFDGSAFQLSRGGVGVKDVFDTRVNLGHASFCGFVGLGTAGDCTAIPTSNIRYDSPTFAGFSVSATWGEDDLWDVAARYSGEVGGFKLGAGISYAETTDENFTVGTTFNKKRSEFFQVGAYAQHVASGLFVYGAYGKEDNNSIVNVTGAGAQPFTADGDRFYVKAGIIQKWNALGNTVLWGEYAESNDMFGPALAASGVTGSEFQQWGLGALQQIDAAAMSVWLKYRHYDIDLEGGALAGSYDSYNTVILGGLINF
ncbi:MAG: porin [Hyphomicrobium sp.]